jgi:hypothetical protein
MADRLPEEDIDNNNDDDGEEENSNENNQRETVAGPYADHPELLYGFNIDIDDEEEAEDEEDIGNDYTSEEVQGALEHMDMEALQAALRGNHVDVQLMWNVVNMAQLWIDSDRNRESHRASLNLFVANLRNWEFNVRMWLDEQSEESGVLTQERAVLYQKLFRELADSAQSLMVAIYGNMDRFGPQP